MRNSIASYKESLSRIANEVLDAAQAEAREKNPFSLRPTLSHSFPLANGNDSGYIDEIAKYRADVQKLQASESEIKALSFNYAALLKEKEEQLHDLLQENLLLRKSLEARKDNGSLLSDESPSSPSNDSVTSKGDMVQASIKPQRVRIQNSHPENIALGTFVSKQHSINNGSATPKAVIEFDNLDLSSKGQEKLLEEVKALKVVQAGHQFEMMLLKEQLDKERANISQLKIQLHEEYQLKEASQRELRARDIEKSSNTEDLQEQLDRNLSELKRLQEEVNIKDLKYDESMESLNSEIHRLEKEKTEAMAKKDELEEKLNYLLNNKPEKNDAGSPDLLDASKNESKEMASKIREFEEALNGAYKERNKALQELSRLKQHLLDKELEDEDKMDEDYKIIGELRTMTEFQRVQILQLEKTLLVERTKGEHLQEQKSDEVHQLNDIIKCLKQKVTNLMSINDAKNVELQNLQTALGQYYAESEAKERFVNELTVAREESTKYSKLLNVADQFLETSKRENEETNARLLQTERMLSESKDSLRKLEEDNSKLRHALERSMTTLNRMSLDSDNYVDRYFLTYQLTDQMTSLDSGRIVIKLLVTYFQRNHSREVLDLMIRMLGFSEEDKQRIGFAQHSVGKKGVVRGVLGLPGRLVGGVLGGNSNSASSRTSENQSFSDLWVDFLLKEAEEREKRESSEDGQRHSVEQSSTARGFVAPPSPSAQNSPHQRNSYN